MKPIFETFRPKNPIIKKYIDYYYLEIKPDNTINEFQCFPHYNNTISIYQSHIQSDKGEIAFSRTAKPLQIFTPIREKVLNVRQSGNVYRIVIVFYPLGIQQFYKGFNFADYIINFEFLTQQELKEIFSTTNTDTISDLLDLFFEKRFNAFKNAILEQSIQYIFENCENFSITELSNSLKITRQHLSRVFKVHLGVSVKKFQEIVVFRQTINKKLFKDHDGNFTALAYEFNYNDQSHFIKTYKKFTANPPKAFFDKGTVLGEEDLFWHLQP